MATAVAKNQQSLGDIFKEPTYEELKEALQKWLDPESSEEEETPVAKTEEFEDDFDAEPKSNAKPPVNKVDNVSSAFDALFND